MYGGFVPRLAALTAAAAFALLFLPVPAQATGDHAQRGQPCTTVGATGKDRSGDLYVCEQRPGDPCPVWHSKHPRKGPWPSRSPVDCPGCPSTPPSAPPSVPPSVPASSAPPIDIPPVVYSHDVPPQLPVTGAKVWVSVVAGAVLVGVGVLVRWAGRRRGARKNEEPAL